MKNQDLRLSVFTKTRKLLVAVMKKTRRSYNVNTPFGSKDCLATHTASQQPTDTNVVISL